MHQWRPAMTWSTWGAHSSVLSITWCFIDFLHSTMCLFAVCQRKPLLVWHHVRKPTELKKHFIKNLHTNWSSIKGLTDTLALSGGPEIKTTGSELWKVCSPSPRCARGILQDKQWERLALVVSHRSRSSYTWQKPRRMQSNTADVCKTIRGGQKMKGLAEDEKGTPLNTWRRWKMNEWTVQQRDPGGS